MNISKVINVLVLQNTFSKFIKSAIITLAVLFIAFTAYLINVQNEQNLNAVVHESLRVIPPVEKLKKQIQKEIAIEKAAEIIVRDGKNINSITAKKYAKWIYAAGEKHKVNPVLILSVMSVESNFNAKAQSPTGPIGLLQVAYTYHKEKTTRAGLYDAKNNIDVGTQILAEYKGQNDAKTLNRYYGGSVDASGSYARKVIFHKNKYEKEIQRAVDMNKI